MLRNFTPVKIQRLRPGLNPQTWVPEASMLTTRPPKPSDLQVNMLGICEIRKNRSRRGHTYLVEVYKVAFMYVS